MGKPNILKDIENIQNEVNILSGGNLEEKANKAEITEKFGDKKYQPPNRVIIYIDSLNGNDENDGISESTAFKTWGRVQKEVPLNPIYGAVDVISGQQTQIFIIGNLDEPIVLYNTNNVVIHGITTNKENHIIKGLRLSGMSHIFIRYLTFQDNTNFPNTRKTAYFNLIQHSAFEKCDFKSSQVPLVYNRSTFRMLECDFEGRNAVEAYTESIIEFQACKFNVTGSFGIASRSGSKIIVGTSNTINDNKPLVNIGTGGSVTEGNYGGINSMGSNANGRWVRFEDGTQICYFASIYPSILADAISDNTWIFPASFYSRPSINTSLDNGNGDVQYITSMLKAIGSSVTSQTIRIRNTYSSPISVNVHWQAIGRWR